MFSKKEASQQAAPAAPSKSAAPSLLSSDLLVNGNLESKGDMQVDGTVEGDIKSVKLTISATAVVRGSVEAESIVIAGQVVGQIKARHVTLAKSAKVVADVIQERLTIEPGAFFEGNCRHFPNEEGKSEREPRKLEQIVSGRSAPAAPALKPVDADAPATGGATA